MSLFINRIRPFDAKMRGGVFVAVANLDADAKFEIVIGSGFGGGSRVETYDFANLKVEVGTGLATVKDDRALNADLAALVHSSLGLTHYMLGKLAEAKASWQLAEARCHLQQLPATDSVRIAEVQVKLLIDWVALDEGDAAAARKLFAAALETFQHPTSGDAVRDAECKAYLAELRDGDAAFARK